MNTNSNHLGSACTLRAGDDALGSLAYHTEAVRGGESVVAAAPGVLASACLLASDAANLRAEQKNRFRHNEQN